MSIFFKNQKTRSVPMRTNTPSRRPLVKREIASTPSERVVPHKAAVEIIEDDPETSWALWAEAVAIQDEFYAQTAPSPLK